MNENLNSPASKNEGQDNQKQPPPAMPPDRDPSSAQIARIAGIPIRVHFTFLLFLIWISFTSFGNGTAVSGILFVIGLFVCVALHELGHALTALHYGIRTASITLYPIGGIARITERPEPAQELRIALAGPLVNIAIAAVLTIILMLRHQTVGTNLTANLNGSFIKLLLQANVILALFNLIPAFPMDGGRILRAALALFGMSIEQATRISARAGQFLAFVFGFGTIYYAVHNQQPINWLWLIIAYFIYVGAGQEAQMVTQEATFAGVPLSTVMLTDVETLVPGNSLKEVAERLLHTSQHDFPVMLGEQVVGLLTRNKLLQGLATEGPDAYVAATMMRDFNSASPLDDLARLLKASSRDGTSFSQSMPLLVMDGERLMGMVTSENIAEYFAIQQILGRRVQS